MVSRFVRKVRTASGAVAVQVVTKDRGRLVEVDHLGSAHTDAEPAVVVAYHKLYRVAQSFPMAKSDLAARPIFHQIETVSRPTSPSCSRSRGLDGRSSSRRLVVAPLVLTRALRVSSSWDSRPASH